MEFVVILGFAGMWVGIAVAAFWWSVAAVFGFTPPSHDQQIGLVGIFAIGAPIAIGLLCFAGDCRSALKRGGR